MTNTKSFIQFGSVGETASFTEPSSWKKIGRLVAAKQLDTLTLVWVVCRDRFEDGHVVALVDANGEVIRWVQYRGDCRYPSLYLNKLAAERTYTAMAALDNWSSVQSAFSHVNDNRYFFVEAA